MMKHGMGRVSTMGTCHHTAHIHARNTPVHATHTYPPIRQHRQHRPGYCCLHRPPRPPIVRPEWCETAHQYARRVLDQLMDYVVQSQHPDTTGLVGTEFHAEANSEGIATIYLPPGAVVSVSVNVREDFEEEDSTNTKTLTRVGCALMCACTQKFRAHLEGLMPDLILCWCCQTPPVGEVVEGMLMFQDCRALITWLLVLMRVQTRFPPQEPEQFLGFQLQRICHIFPSVLHAVTGEPLAGFTIKAYDVTHLVPDPPRPGPTPMPSPAPTPKRMSKCVHSAR